MEIIQHEFDDAAREREIIEQASIALVREFLNRKGCKKSLSALDEEIPRIPSSICNRADLAQALHVAPLIRKNKSLEFPFRTIIEIISWDLVNSRRSSSKSPTRSRPSTARRSGGSPGRYSYNGNEHQQRPQSGRGLRAYNPQINPMDISGLTVSNSGTKAKKVSSVEEMLSASPEKVMSSHDVSNGDKQKKTTNEDKKSRNIDVNELKKKQEFILQDLDDDQMDMKCIRWLTGQDRPTFSYNPVGVKAEDLHKNATTGPTKKEKTPKQRGRTSRKVGFNLKPAGAPLDFETAVQLRRLVFGSSSVRGFNDEWINQAFSFRDCKDERTTRLRFGIIQKRGGPCGLLAAVQSFVLKHLLFGKVGNDGCDVRQAKSTALDVSNEIRTSCLAEAIIEILWRAGSGRRAVVASLTNKQTFTPPGGYKEDGITEFINTTNCHSLESLHQTIYGSINQFESGRGASILLLYSAILSRGISEVISDMDDPGNMLMGAHSYCTQEMVNLLTIGIAASNTFDDKMTLDEGLVLRGIPNRSDIGLLSLFEHYNSCTVGENLKTPRYPIWIVCSESHFSVLFSLHRDVANDEEKAFDLYYYDGLANQDEEMRLTVDTTRAPPHHDANDLTPPLEFCIQTKWPNCVIDWNGTEPLL